MSSVHRATCEASFLTDTSVNDTATDTLVTDDDFKIPEPAPISQLVDIDELLRCSSHLKCMTAIQKPRPMCCLI